jgi:hypothetical protein
MALRAVPLESEQRQLINTMPTLYALETLFRPIFHQRQGSHGVLMEHAWDASAISKNKFTYQMLQDIDAVLTCVYNLIRPVEQPKVYFPVFLRSDLGVILYNLSTESPLIIHGSIAASLTNLISLRSQLGVILPTVSISVFVSWPSK